MADPLAGVLGRPFVEQVAALRLRLGNLVPADRWDEMIHQAHDRGFTVAGATKAALLADLALAVDRAISQGTSLETFRAEFKEIVARHGWTGWTGEGTEAGRAWRSRVIYRTNASTTYAAGRLAQLQAGHFAYWVYRHGGSAHPRHDHLAIDGLILPADHPFWAIWAPPNGWGCSCHIVGARTLAGARRVGGKQAVQLPEGWDRIDPETGAPRGIDRGWAYAPGMSVTSTIRLAAEKIATLPPLIGSDLGRSMDAVIDRAWPVWVADTLARGSHRPGLAGVIRRQEIDALAALDINPASAEITVKPGLVVGPKATRHEARGDALAEMEWLTLPQLLRMPMAVLLDRKTGKLLYILAGEGLQPQLTLSLDLLVKGAARTENMVISAYGTEAGNIRARLKGGDLQLISGSLEEAAG